MLLRNFHKNRKKNCRLSFCKCIAQEQSNIQKLFYLTSPFASAFLINFSQFVFSDEKILLV